MVSRFRMFLHGVNGIAIAGARSPSGGGGSTHKLPSFILDGLPRSLKATSYTRRKLCGVHRRHAGLYDHCRVRARGNYAFLSKRMVHASSFARARDFYDILGAKRSDSKEEIKKKYRKLAKKYHPDTSTEENAKEKFQEISQAWDVLQDDEQRRLYDMYGHQMYTENRGDFGSSETRARGGGINLEDLFRNMGGAGGFEEFFAGATGTARQPRPMMGRDVRVAATLDFMEAIDGCSRELRYKAHVACSSCKATGAKNGDPPKYAVCGSCHGTGMMERTIGGMMQLQTPCTNCQGTGQKMLNECPSCHGFGIIEGQRSSNIQFPPGVEDGMRLSHPGGGSYGELGGPPGDLLVEISVKPHPHFKREGPNIYSNLALSLSQAVLGDVVDISTITGNTQLTIKPGVNNGETLRLPGKGARNLNAPATRGDHFVKLSIKMPKNLTPRQRELMVEFEQEERHKKQSKDKSASS